MIKIQITADHGNSHSAWAKAPADVATIAEELGFERVAAGRYWPEGQAFIRRVFRKFRMERLLNRVCWKLELASIRRRFGKNGGELLFQHPLPCPWSFDNDNIEDISALKRIGIKLTVIVHDIGALRGSSADVGGSTDHSFEDELLKIADKIVVHNEVMKNYVSRLGVRGDVMALGIFDYLVLPCIRMFEPKATASKNSVLVAGAFGPGKAKYVRDLKNIKGVEWMLYGINYDHSTMDGENVHYKGIFESDCPPIENSCKFALVWDGDSVDTCSGPTGEYLRINNPHKLSLYLSMGMPVIVWKEAAVAAFVKRSGVGIAVGSLNDIAEKLSAIDDASYNRLINNAKVVACKLRRGDFTRSVLECSEQS